MRCPCKRRTQSLVCVCKCWEHDWLSPRAHANYLHQINHLRISASSESRFLKSQPTTPVWLRTKKVQELSSIRNASMLNTLCTLLPETFYIPNLNLYSDTFFPLSASHTETTINVIGANIVYHFGILKFSPKDLIYVRLLTEDQWQKVIII